MSANIEFTANQRRKIYLIGGGIASLASAAYFIKDGQIEGDQILILEELNILGGSLDGAGSPDNGYVLRGGRMLNFSYQCTYDLLSFIPSMTSPNLTVLDEIRKFNAFIKTSANARIVSDGLVMDVSTMGFSNQDRLDLVEIMEVSENYLDHKRIDEWFDESFFETNFWYMWATMFAFQPWHSAIEFKRYLHRFIHEFKRINTLAGVDRTPYNQYDSIVRPLVQWLKDHGVRFDINTEVTGLDFRSEREKKIVERIHYLKADKEMEIRISPEDLVLVTNGSMTADSRLGSMGLPPELVTQKTGGSWKLWEAIAKQSPDFGRPFVFDSRIDESKWVSFTVTCQGTEFFELIEKFSGNKAGTGALITFKNSHWLMSIVLAYQPHFIGQPKNVTVFWGYALFPDKIGNFVKSKMSDCRGKDILTELFGHLKLTDHSENLMKTSNCIPCMMPYITSQFLTRVKGDRPEVVPECSVNLAFIGQFAEVEDDVVFTVEYSVRTAQTAVYKLLALDKKPTPIYKGTHHFNVLFDAVKTLVE